MSASISSPCILAIATKWLVIGRFKPGRYPIWGVYYFRWWLVQRMLTLTHIKWFQGSPLMRVYLQALGAKIGQDANISELEIGAVDLLTIGARHDRRRPRQILQCQLRRRRHDRRPDRGRPGLLYRLVLRART